MTLPAERNAVIGRLDAACEYRDGCLIWTRGTSGDGYGATTFSRRQYGAHRLACELERGPAPEGKSWALHHCDQPLCIRPDHLYWGSPTDNARDREDRGRGKSGWDVCASGAHRFTEENTYIHEGRRRCRACRAERSKRYYYSQKAAS